MNIHDYFDQLKSTTKTKEKKQILEDIKESDCNELFLRIAKLALDKRHKYYIVQFDSNPSEHDNTLTLEEALDQIEQKFLVEKIRGNEAIESLENIYKQCNERDSELIKNIINRTLKCGVSSITVNKTWPDAIYIHPHSSCSSFNEKNLKNIKLPAISQLKEDGMYTDIVMKVEKDEMNVEYRSRQGEYNDWNDAEIDNELLKATNEAFGRDMVVMGECLVVDENNNILRREEGNGKLNSDDFDPKYVRYRLWDIIPHNDWLNHKHEVGYESRLELLKDFLNKLDHPQFELVDTREVHTKDDIVQHFKENVKQGLEGSIVKNKDAIWESKRLKDEVKIKIIFDVELVVTDVYEGEANKKYEGQAGGLVGKTSDGKLVSHVGGGLTDDQRKSFFDDPESIIGKVITVKANDILYDSDKESYCLSHPRLAEVRSDKDEADSLERVFEQKDASVNSIAIVE